MSAFVMDEQFFNQLANELSGRCYSHNATFHYPVCEFLGVNSQNTFDRMDERATIKAQELYEANVEAVNQRYDSDDLAPFEVKPASGFVKMSDIQLYKYLQCLSYQMCEGDVKDSAIYKSLEKMICKMAQALVSQTAEYNKADWSYVGPTHEVTTECVRIF